MSYTRLSLNGHKLIRWTSGVEDTYQQGRCECGQWEYNGWTEQAAAVTRQHNDHVEEMREQALPAWEVQSFIGDYRMGDQVVHAGTAKRAALIAWRKATSQKQRASELTLKGDRWMSRFSGGYNFIVTGPLNGVKTPCVNAQTL